MLPAKHFFGTHRTKTKEVDVEDRMSRSSFFDLLRGLPSGDLMQIQIAYWLAKNAHRPQKPRDNGDRFFEHPRAVAVTLIKRGHRDRDTVTLCLLHDVVEDTNTPPQVIVDLFPNSIWEGLYILSKYVPVFDPITGQIFDRTKKPTEEYFKAIAEAELRVRLVKLADRLSNLGSMHAWTPERKAKYIAETEEFILPIAETTDPWFAQELREAIAAVQAGA